MSADQSLFGVPPDPVQTGEAFRELCAVIARLRAPDGCPWDREQTLETIKPHTLEETYELLEAIDSGEDAAIVEELGDLLLQVVLDAQIGRDEQRFDLLQVIQGVTRKLIHRHPHVFGDAEANSAAEVLRNWEQAKASEKKRESILEGIPAALPQLARAVKITKRAAKVGFDFPQREMLFDKLQEEIRELAAELFADGQLPAIPAGVEAERIPDAELPTPEQRDRVESELGDLLFVIANIARRWGIDPEEALRRSNQKFTARFQAIETAIRKANRDIKTVSLREMEDIYQQIKAAEKQGQPPE